MIIIVFGLPGSGKSFFASRLAQHIQARYLSSDETRTAMKASGKYTFEDKRTVYQKMVMEADQAVKRGENIVVDGTFYRHKLRNLFTSLAASYHTAIYFIEITADEEIVRERLAKKRTQSEADYGVYQLVGQQFEHLDTPHLKIKSDRANINEMVSEALNYLKMMDA